MLNRIIITFFILHSALIIAQYQVTTFAGSDSGYVNAKLTEAKFSTAFGICIDKDGNLFIADAGNNCIRKIDTNGVVSTYAGTGAIGNVDDLRTKASFNSPTGVCTDGMGNLYISDFLNHTIRKVDREGNVTTLAGSGQAGFSDGYGLQAQFNFPRGIDIDSDGNLYIGDSWNHRVRKIAPDGNVTTYAGGGDQIGTDSKGSCVDGPDTTARFFTPCGISVDNFGNVYVADALNHRIRKIDKFRNVTTVAGTGESGWGNGGFFDGNYLSVMLNTPTELFVTPDGEILFSDTFGNRIRMVQPTGEVITIAGDGTAGDKDSIGQSSQFNYPRGIALDSSNNNIYIVDSRNYKIRLIPLMRK